MEHSLSFWKSQKLTLHVAKRGYCDLVGFVGFCCGFCLVGLAFFFFQIKLFVLMFTTVISATQKNQWCIHLLLSHCEPCTLFQKTHHLLAVHGMQHFTRIFFFRDFFFSFYRHLLNKSWKPVQLYTNGKMVL